MEKPVRGLSGGLAVLQRRQAGASVGDEGHHAGINQGEHRVGPFTTRNVIGRHAKPVSGN